MKILVTGVAGYKGSALVPELLKQGHGVIGVDNLIFSPQTLLPYYLDDHFTFVKGDIRDYDLMKKLVKDVDGIIHLAAITGFPACHKYPKLAMEVNLEATKKLVDFKTDRQFFIFASTCSNYGARGTDRPCDEETELEPLSEYGITKVRAEEYVRRFPNTAALRIATGFGVSPRLRLDLLINDLTYQALQRKKLKIYETWHRRSFIHTKDIVRAYSFAVDNYKEMSQQAYNVGDKKLNKTKKEIVEIIQKETSCDVEFVDSGKDMDQRDYVIDFTKISKIGLQCKISIEEGIRELKMVLLDLMESGALDSPLKDTFSIANYSKLNSAK